MLRTLLMLGGIGAAAYYLSDKTRRDSLMKKAESLRAPLTDLADKAAAMMQTAQTSFRDQRASATNDALELRN
jgi:hypothetical protein